jgi:hypothetical protein
MNNNNFLPHKSIPHAKFKGVALTKAKKKEFLLEYYKHGFVNMACSDIGITRGTYKQWRHHDKTFKAYCDEVLEARLDLAEMKLMDNIREGKESSLLFFLKTKGRKRGYVTEDNKEEVTVDFDFTKMNELPREKLIKLLE